MGNLELGDLEGPGGGSESEPDWLGQNNLLPGLPWRDDAFVTATACERDTVAQKVLMNLNQAFCESEVSAVRNQDCIFLFEAAVQPMKLSC